MASAYVVISGVDGPPSYPEPTVIAGFVVFGDDGVMKLSAPPGALGSFSAGDSEDSIRAAVTAAVRESAGDPALTVTFITG